MLFYIFMIILSPFTAIIPMVHSVYLIATGRIKIEKNYWNISLFAIYCWSVVVAIFNNSILSFLGSFMLLGYCAIAINAQNYFKTRKKINDTLKMAAYGTALVAAVGIFENIIFAYFGKPEHRMYSTFGNPNMTGAWFACSIFIILYLKRTRKTKLENRIYNLTLVLAGIALFETESTGAMIALVGSMMVYIILNLAKSRKGIIAMIVAGVVASLVTVIMMSNGMLSAIINEIAHSFDIRVDIWQGSLQMIFQKPLTGWGILGTLEHGVNFFSRNGNSIHSHNLWLALLTTGGIIGFSIYMYMKFKLIKDVVKLFKRKEPMVLLIITINLMVIIQGLVDVSLYAPQLGIMFMTINSIAINLVTGKIANKTRVKERKIIPINRESIVA